ncbi:MAG: hypothetical protein HC849_12760 [Oscillatoriales cyanobacterium RU_3_3]|nr:hypothetical protein [Microcoleus sp. SU_5_6]NJM60876.1 hypothetical protein [Oscillatoriales cyanobacterium RU_3_3]NJR21017.1 hypothetical protein [Richelia sp. CSU_2_1]
MTVTFLATVTAILARSRVCSTKASEFLRLREIVASKRAAPLVLFLGNIC